MTVSLGGVDETAGTTFLIGATGAVVVGAVAVTFFAAGPSSDAGTTAGRFKIPCSGRIDGGAVAAAWPLPVRTGELKEKKSLN